MNYCREHDIYDCPFHGEEVPTYGITYAENWREVARDLKRETARPGPVAR